MTAARVNGIILFLCAMALASMIEPVPDPFAPWYWVFLSTGVMMAAAGLFWPKQQPAAFLGVAFFLVVMPCILQMQHRRRTSPEEMCHDSVIQFEDATAVVMRGGNPYAMSFRGTALEEWKGWKENPALDHFVYPPLLLYLSIPFRVAGSALGFFDQRVVLLLFFAGLVALLFRLLKDHPHFTAIASLVALNPWFGPFVVEGRTDVAMLFFVAAAWLAHVSGHRLYGNLLLGLGIAAKTMLLPVIPFLVALHRREWKSTLAVLLAPLAVTSAYFLLLDPVAFLEDLFLAPAGIGDNPFEIRGWGGFGFANLVLLLGLVDTPRDYFPFSIFQFAALLPCLAYGLRSLKKEPDFGNALFWSAVTIFALLFFGRFIHDNYIGVLLAMLVISQVARESPEAARSTPPAA